MVWVEAEVRELEEVRERVVVLGQVMEWADTDIKSVVILTNPLIFATHI